MHYTSITVVVIPLTRMAWSEHVVRTREITAACKILVGTPQGENKVTILKWVEKT